MPDRSPLVSVVTPVYNAERYLADTISGVLGQRMKDLELILIDDGSSDRSLDIMAGFQDPRIQLVRNEKNMGVVATRNKGIALSRGRYIAFNDADDIPLPDKLEKQVAYLEQHPEVGICGTYYQLIDTQGTPGEKVPLPSSEDDVALMSKFINPFCNSATLTRAELIKGKGFEKSFEYAEDFRLWTSLLAETRGVNLPEYSVLYRVHGSNISIVNRETMWRAGRQIQSEGLDALQVPYTARELDIHNRFLYCQPEGFATPGAMKELEKWLLKVYHASAKRFPAIDQLSLKSLWFDNWIAIAFNTGNYPALVFPRLASIAPWAYYRALLTKTTRKFAKKKPS